MKEGAADGGGDGGAVGLEVLGIVLLWIMTPGSNSNFQLNF